MERGLIFRELIKQLLSLGLFYFLMRVWWGDEQWFIDKVKELSFFISVGFLFLIVSLLTHILSRPIIIDIAQTNKHFERPETTFSISGIHKTQEHERVVDLKINVLKNKSIWTWLTAKVIERMDIHILIEPVTSGLVLDAENESIRTDLVATEKGFKIKAGEYISRILKRSNSGEHSKGCEYVIQEDRDNVVSNELFHINPILLAGNREAPLWLTFFIRLNNYSHIVHFKWE
jgi:hypothetical protein